jgi:hypothetical protein
MIRRLGVIVVWVVATLVATAVALAAVRSVAGQVVDGPDSPLVAATTTFGPDAASATTMPTTKAAPPATTLAPVDLGTTSLADEAADGNEPVPDANEGSDAATTSEATQAPPATTTSTTLAPTTTEAPTTTTTTEAPIVEPTETYQLIGGWVRIASSPGVVSLDGAGPNAGFSVEVQASGPERVKVEFRNDNHESEFEAAWRGEDLKIEISEESETND